MDRNSLNDGSICRALFERSPEGLVFCDPSFSILVVNDEFCRMFGYKRENIVGRDLDGVVTKRTSATIEAKILSEEYLRSGAIQTEAIRHKADGTPFPVSIVATPVVIDGVDAGSLTIYRDISERRRREEDIRNREAKFRDILDSHPELILRFTPDLVTTYANKAYCNYHGITYGEAVGRSFADHVAPEYIPLVLSKLRSLSPEKPAETSEEKVLMASGEIRWQEWTDQGIFAENGRLIEIQSVGRDITERKRMEEALAFEKEALDLLFENANEGIVLCKNDGTIVRANPMFCRMFDYIPGEVLGQNIDEMVAAEPAMTREAKNLTLLTANGKSVASESSRQRKDGSQIEVSFLGVPIKTKKGAGFAFGIYRDITDRKHAEEEMQRLNRELFTSATTDNVTGLLNRQHFEEILGREIARAARYRTPLSLIMLDLDSFKKINDSCGHLAGDMALKKIADVIKNNIRASDLAARWGGDEFALASPTSLEHTGILAEKIRGLLLELGHEGFGPVTGSFGISSCREGDSIDSLTSRADNAMYHAKRMGGNSICTR